MKIGTKIFLILKYKRMIVVSLIEESRLHRLLQTTNYYKNIKYRIPSQIHLNFEYDKTYQRVYLEIRTSNAEKYFLNSTKTEVDLGKTLKQQNWNLFAKIRNPNAYSAKLTV